LMLLRLPSTFTQPAARLFKQSSIATSYSVSTRSLPFSLRSSFSTSAFAMAPQRIKLAAASELPKPGQKKDFVAFGEGDDALKILLSNVKGEIYATSAKW
jgi:hypothetical protein